jgi:hypothetical protein
MKTQAFALASHAPSLMAMTVPSGGYSEWWLL